MPIVDLFSKRQKKLQGEVPDVYVYDDLPRPLKVQIIQIWRETLGYLQIERGEWGQIVYNSNVEHAYRYIVESLCHEYGDFQLAGPYVQLGIRNTHTELETFFLEEKIIAKALDAVELSFDVIDHVTRKQEYLQRNKRFRNSR